MISGIPAMAMMSPGPAPLGPASTRWSAVGHVELGDARSLEGAVVALAAPGDRFTFLHPTLVDPADRQAAHVRRGVEVADQRLERVALDVRRRRDVLHEQLEEDLEVRCVGRPLRGSAPPGRCGRCSRRPGTRCGSSSAPRSMNRS